MPSLPHSLTYSQSRQNDQGHHLGPCRRISQQQRSHVPRRYRHCGHCLQVLAVRETAGSVSGGTSAGEGGESRTVLVPHALEDASRGVACALVRAVRLSLLTLQSIQTAQESGLPLSFSVLRPLLPYSPKTRDFFASAARPNRSVPVLCDRGRPTLRLGPDLFTSSRVDTELLVLCSHGHGSKMDKYGALQAPRLPSSSSRRSIASDASRGPASAIASGSGAGLRKRDVARHELEMLQREEAERRDAYAHQVDGVNVHTLPAMPPRPRRTSNHSTSSHHYRQAPMLQPQGRQLSSGSIPSQQQQQYNAWEPPQRSHATHERRTKRSGSNVSRTSTVLSAGLARRAVAAAAAAVDEPRTQPGSQSAIGQNLHAFDPRRYLRDQDGHSGARPQDSPLRRWVRLIEKTGRRETKRGHAREWAVALAAIVWVKWAVGIGGWSGKLRRSTS